LVSDKQAIHHYALDRHGWNLVRGEETEIDCIFAPMALNSISYPVTGTAGAYSNIFPSQRPLDFTATRKDVGITSISSGAGGVVQIEAAATLTDIAVGDYITWGTDAYTARSSRVTAVIAVDTIEVDALFSSTNVTNGFLNYKKNWFLEIRYVEKDSATDDQDAIALFDFNAKYNSSIVGLVSANIALPYVFLVPDFDTTANGFNTGLYTEYKIQFRESWENNRSELWESPSTDIKIMLVHGTEDIEPLKFSDYGQLKRYVRGYPLMTTFIYSDVNDGVGGNQITLLITEYTIDKLLVTDYTLATLSNFNGVYSLVIDPSTLDASTVFIELVSEYVADIGQYDPDDYDPSDYA